MNPDPAPDPPGREDRPAVARRRLSGRVLRLAIWILVGLALRTVALGGDGLWCDEGYTAWTSHLSAAEHWIARSHDDAPPFYYAIQRMLIPHLPPTEASVRLLSAAAGVAGIVWLAVAPPIPGLVEIPTAFLAIGTYGVYFGRLARSYTFLMLFGLIMMTATHRFLDGKRRWLAAVILAETLALWTHNAAAPMIAGANLAWLLCGRRDPLRWIGGQVLVLLLWLPYLLHAAPQFAIHAEANRWISEYWKSVPLAAAPVMSLGAFTSGALLLPPPPAERWFYEGPGGTVVAVVAFGAVAVLLVTAFLRGARRDALFCAAFTLGPLIALAAASALTTPAYILARTDAIGYGGFVLWAALGLRRLPRIPRAAVLAILIASTALAVAVRFPVGKNRHGNDREIGMGLRELLRPGDWIVYLGPTRPSIDYYVSGGRPGKEDEKIHRVHYPAFWEDNPAAAYPLSPDSVRVWEKQAYRLRDQFVREGGPPDRHLYFVGLIRPDRPPDVTAAELPYPGSILAYVLNGVRPLKPIARGRGDAMGADWLVFRIRPGDLEPLDDLHPVEPAP
jgi:hypothetical protein